MSKEARLGRVMEYEMREQPRVLDHVIGRRERLLDEVSEKLPRSPRGVAVVARGTSDNAALFGRYLIEYTSGLIVSQVAPSLLTLYGSHVDYSGFVAVAASQSGQTREIIAVLERLQELGAFGVAVTNDRSSSLGEIADLVLGLEAGPELAVPATKTFTAQIAVFTILAEALGSPSWSTRDWDRVPIAAQSVLDDDLPARQVAAEIGEAPGIICVGRGFMFPIALEAALKLKETSRILAEGHSAADLRHGPIAVIEEDFPVLAFTGAGPTETDMQDLIETLRARGAKVFEVGSSAHADVRIPDGLPEVMEAMPAVIRAQQVALWLARHRDMNPDRPPGLSKVTAG